MPGFHEICDDKITLSENRTVAKTGYDGGTVFSAEPMSRGERFSVRVNKKGLYSQLFLGVTEHDPQEWKERNLQHPKDMTRTWCFGTWTGHTWIHGQAAGYCAGWREEWGTIHPLSVGEVVSVTIYWDGSLSVTANNTEFGGVFSDLPDVPLWIAIRTCVRKLEVLGMAINSNIPRLMTKDKASLLQTNYVALIATMRPEPVAKRLYYSYVITKEENAEIRKMKTSRSKSASLLRVLETKADDAFYLFRKALVKTGQCRLAVLLDYIPPEDAGVSHENASYYSDLDRMSALELYTSATKSEAMAGSLGSDISQSQIHCELKGQMTCHIDFTTSGNTQPFIDDVSKILRFMCLRNEMQGSMPPLGIDTSNPFWERLYAVRRPISRIGLDVILSCPTEMEFYFISSLYNTRQLDHIFQKTLITREIKKAHNIGIVTLVSSISAEDFRKAIEYLSARTQHNCYHEPPQSRARPTHFNCTQHSVFEDNNGDIEQENISCVYKERSSHGHGQFICEIGLM